MSSGGEELLMLPADAQWRGLYEENERVEDGFEAINYQFGELEDAERIADPMAPINVFNLLEGQEDLINQAVFDEREIVFLEAPEEVFALAAASQEAAASCAAASAAAADGLASGTYDNAAAPITVDMTAGAAGVDDDTAAKLEPGQEVVFPRGGPGIPGVAEILSFEEDTHNIGDLSLTVLEVKSKCMFSTKQQSYHLKSSSGPLNIRVPIAPEWVTGHYTVIHLRRTSVEYRNNKIDRVCNRHRGKAEMEKRSQVLRVCSEVVPFYFYVNNQDGGHNGLVLEVKKTTGASMDIPLKIMCNDSCANSSDESFKALKNSPERARDMELVVAICSFDGQIKARSKLVVWPKASVVPRDLYKSVRREPKGASALKHQGSSSRVQKKKPAAAAAKQVQALIKKAVRQLSLAGYCRQEAEDSFRRELDLVFPQCEPVLLKPKKEEAETGPPSTPTVLL